jgi:CspA family cold shock protein
MKKTLNMIMIGLFIIGLSSIANAMTTGTVKSYNESKGFGLIEQDNGSGDVFVLKDDIVNASTLPVGAKVDMEVEQGSKGAIAKKVTVIH